MVKRPRRDPHDASALQRAAREAVASHRIGKPPIRLSGGPPSVNRLGPPRRGDSWEWERLEMPAELLRLGTMVEAMERMSPAERRRCLVYLVDRYGRGHLFGDAPRFDPDADGDQHP